MRRWNHSPSQEAETMKRTITALFAIFALTFGAQGAYAKADDPGGTPGKSPYHKTHGDQSSHAKPGKGGGKGSATASTTLMVATGRMAMARVTTATTTATATTTTATVTTTTAQAAHLLWPAPEPDGSETPCSMHAMERAALAVSPS